jgi:hypothetical protein
MRISDDRLARLAEQPAAPAARPVPPARWSGSGSAPSPEAMLQLQRSVGNRAVAIQRQDAPPAPVEETYEHGIPPGYHVIHGIQVCFGAERGAYDIEQHRWLEIYDESYGWYPKQEPAFAPEGFEAQVLLLTVPGILNAQTWKTNPGTHNRDKHHGDSARRFSVAAPVGETYASIAPKLRAFAAGFKGSYSWNPFGTDCHEFVEAMLASCKLIMTERIPDGSPVV